MDLSCRRYVKPCFAQSRNKKGLPWQGSERLQCSHSMSRFFAVALALFCLGCSTMLAQTAAPASRSCPIDRTPLTDADQLLSRGKSKEAQDAYATALLKAPADEHARLGLIRSMLEQGRVSEAQASAAAFAKEKPSSGLPELAQFEVAYRAGDIEGAFAHVKRALALAPCEGQADMGLAQLYDMTGLHATAARYIRRAHLLRPEDSFITREWIATLPYSERTQELSAFLQSNPILPEGALQQLKTEEDYLKARKPGECRIASTTESAQAPLTAISGRDTRPKAYGLEVAFDGKKRRMQIDTGAGGIVLTDGTARGLGLSPEYVTKTTGLGSEGSRDSYLTHVHSLRIGAVELQDCMVRVVKESGIPVDGLIGMDVFRRWLVTLDYQAAQLRLAPLPRDPKAPASGGDPDEDELPRDSYVAPEMQDWLRVARIGHSILLPAALKPTGNLHYMILDTGAESSMFSVPVASEAGQLRATSMQFVGISGKTKTMYVSQDTPLYIGTLHLLPDSYYATDLTNISSNLNFEVGGFFGLNTLQRLTIQVDYRDNLLKLVYDPKHDLVRFH